MADGFAVPCWTRENADAILQTQALAAQDAIFLATHSPVRDFDGASEKFDLQSPTQEGLLETLASPTRRHAFCVVQGEPGSGKSHLIRWLQVNWPNPNDFVLLIQRADGSLLGALNQLRNKLPRELGHLFDRLGQRHAAGLEGRAFQFLTNLGAMLTVNYFDDPPEDIEWCREFEPDKLILAAQVRENWQGPARVLGIMNGGEDRNSASATFDIPDVLEIAEIWHTHSAGDSEKAQRLGRKLSTESSHIEEARNAGRSFDEIRTECAEKIPNTLQMVQALNARRNQAVQDVLGVSADALKQLFMDLRLELARQDEAKPLEERRRLVLLLEDVTMWEGLDDSLIDALVADATLRDGDVCPLISVIGLTTEYYRQLKNNYQQRITHSIRLGVSSEGQVKQIATLGTGDRTRFVSRYLSAVRAGVDQLQDWRDAYRTDQNLAPPNPCETCPRLNPCFNAFGDIDGVGLFPFTAEAIDGFYEALKPDDHGQTHRTPRGMLQGVLNPTLLTPERMTAGAYPGPEIESRYLEQPLLDASLRMVIQNHAEDPQTEVRLTRLMRYWGDRRPHLTSEDGFERYAGVPREVLEAFALPWLGAGQSATTVAPERPIAPSIGKPEAGPDRPAETAETPTRPLAPPRPRPVTPVRPTNEPKAATKKDLQRMLDQIETLRSDGILPSSSEWNGIVYAALKEIDPRRLDTDRRTFEQVFTGENVKIAGTGLARATHFVVPRETWLIDGLEAYVRLRADDDLTSNQIEFHRRRLATLGRRLEQGAGAHLDRVLPRTADGRRWSPAAAATQALAARAWLRGGALPTATSAAQWTALLSDEDEPTTTPSVRTSAWQDALNASDRRHAEVRNALRLMISLPQGNAQGRGLADASMAAQALADLRRTLKFSPGVEASTQDLLFADWRGARAIFDQMAPHLPRIPKAEADMMRDRATRLFALLRGRAPRDHDTRLSDLIDRVSRQMLGKASTEVRAWDDEHRKQARLFDGSAHDRLIDVLWRLSPDGGDLPVDAAGLAWLIEAPAGDLSSALDLFNRGETAVKALLPHVQDLVADAAKSVDIDDIHKAGKDLADAAQTARAKLQGADQ
ncbi:hypothetical protein [Brevundimonas nasdae]|uniref:ATP-binding protein n=1 Tax=Brevundimonas nasdae TaxID=172043 RepID=A0ABX8TNN7_9CAUL|nr:hypothetical protein [Brevundimonas nasdae]QYC11505.1 hypothetical protein KWG56_05880 [Brevundimonas nasdae]QYC14293.1 hypothetical protein KWG63_01215 [Brevundimonas nasdae]